MSGPEITQKNINERINRGWSPFDARNTPVGGKRPQRNNSLNLINPAWETREPAIYHPLPGTIIAAIEASKKYKNTPMRADGSNKYTDKIRQVLADLPQLGE